MCPPSLSGLFLVMGIGKKETLSHYERGFPFAQIYSDL